MNLVFKWEFNNHIMLECPFGIFGHVVSSSAVITAQHSPTKICQTQDFSAKNNLINILLLQLNIVLLKPSLLAVSKCTTLCQKKPSTEVHTPSSFSLIYLCQSFSLQSTPSSVHHWLLPYLPLSANTPSFRLLPSQWTSLSQGKKINFCSWLVEVKRYYVPVTAGCAASWSERLRTADHTDRGRRITLTNVRIKAEYKSKI